MHLKRVVVTGGGTAGHVVPTIPVMEELMRHGCRVDFIGGDSGPERGLLAALPISYHAVSTGKLRRYFSLANLADCLRIPVGICQAAWLLWRIRPDVVFSKGGFASFPAVVGAWLNRIPVVAHESDLTPGLANRLARPFRSALCVNFEPSAAVARGRRTVVTGTPLRRALTEGDAVRGRKLLGLGHAPSQEQAPKVLLIVGGSLGAAKLNDVVRDALEMLLRRWIVVHVCGPGRLASALAKTPGYLQYEYIDDGWGDVIAAADLVVSRAGANALYEWLALAKPHLLVPLPRTASRGDQIENAAFAASNGWSSVVPEHELNSSTLVAGIAKLADQSAAVRKRLATFQGRDSIALIINELERAAVSRRRSAG